MLTKAIIFELLLKHQNDLQNFGVKSIGLFGSYKKQDNNLSSDIDIFVDFIKEKKSFKNYTGAYFFLKNLFNKEIDFITPQSLSKHIGPTIINDIEYAFRND